MDSRRDDTVLPVPGFPIRKSPDQSLLSGSPKLIAASHVLHRLLAPRHPPCALNSLTSNARALMRLHSPVTRTFTIQLSKSSDTSSVDDGRTELVGFQMELMGIEPTTPGLQSRCSPS